MSPVPERLAARAKAARRAVQSGQPKVPPEADRYRRWCLEEGLVPAPVSKESLLAWVEGHLILQPSTLKQTVTAAARTYPSVVPGVTQPALNRIRSLLIAGQAAPAPPRSEELSRAQVLAIVVASAPGPAHRVLLARNAVALHLLQADVPLSVITRIRRSDVSWSGCGEDLSVHLSLDFGSGRCIPPGGDLGTRTLSGAPASAVVLLLSLLPADSDLLVGVKSVDRDLDAPGSTVTAAHDNHSLCTNLRQLLHGVAARAGVTWSPTDGSLPKEALERMLMHLDAHKARRLRDQVERTIRLQQGVRVEELLSATCSDVRLVTRPGGDRAYNLTNRNKKNGSASIKVITIDREPLLCPVAALDALLAYHQLRGHSGLLLPNKHGNRQDGPAVSNRFRRDAERADEYKPGVGGRGLRVAAGNRARREGGMQQAKKVLEHGSIDMSFRYMRDVPAAVLDL